VKNDKTLETAARKTESAMSSFARKTNAMQTTKAAAMG